MKATSYFLILVLLSSFCGCSKRPSSQAKSRPAPEPPKQELPDELSQEAEIKAATPEDPGPIATVVSPLAIWTKNGKQSGKLMTSADPEDNYNPPSTSQADHVDISKLPGPRNFLHKRFAVTSYADFPFTLPPHSVSPRLQGSFHSFTKDSPGPGVQPANVELLLMNDQEFNNFVHQQPGDATYAADPAPQQTVDFALKSTLDQPQKYHLVFHNSPGGTKTKLVAADFTVSFE